MQGKIYICLLIAIQILLITRILDLIQ